MKIFNIYLTALALFVVTQPVYAAQYTFTDLGNLGSSSMATGINDLGQVVGSSRITSTGASHATLWQNGSITDLGTLGGSSSVATGINIYGQISGFASTAGDASQHAALWQNGNVTDLGTLRGGYNSGANAINNVGQIVGGSSPGNNVVGVQPVLWQNGSVASLDVTSTTNDASGINNVGQVVGGNIFMGNATLWQNGSAISLGSLGGLYSSAYSINDTGQIVGESYISGSTPPIHATLWQNGSITDLGTLGGTWSSAAAINNSGLIVGKSSLVNNSAQHAVLWQNGNIIDLNSLVSPSVLSAGWTLNIATAVNNNGWIVGSAINSLTGVSDAFILAPVPEPAEWLLMLCGLGLVGYITVRRKERHFMMAMA